MATSVYQNDPGIVAGVTQLPPECATNRASTCATAVVGGSYPYVFNNDTVDGSFGVTSKIVLDQMTPWGRPVGSIEVPNSSQGLPPGADQMVTSFSSKSEPALNLSTQGKYVTFMGYNAPVDEADVSNANTPGASTTAGLQKWVFDPAEQQWNLAYTLQSGLGLGQPYSVPGYPTGENDGPGGSGMRNLTGRVDPDGTAAIWAAIWAAISTVSGSGDQGADPNQLVSVTDNLSADTIPAAESLKTVRSAIDGVVYRGVSFTPGIRA